jgi:UDP-N-acetylmuramoyl-tripeptide--D-alanyl-D-alanine ligase
MSETLCPEVKEYLDSLLSGSRGEKLSGSGFSIDSRTIKNNQTFIALKGLNFNGHNFIEEAISKGAGGVIYQDQNFLGNLDIAKKVNFFKVEDSYDFIYQLAKYKRTKFRFPIIAVSGSNGKTTVKELIAAFLDSKFLVYKNHLNQNNILGVSLNILNCGFDRDYGVFEVGISKEGEIDRILDILRPDHGLITNVSQTHLEFLRDEEVIFKEKIKLFESLKDNSYAFYSKDQDSFRALDTRGDLDLKFKTFGLKRINDHWLNIDSFDLRGLRLNYKDSFSLNSQLLGDRNVFNIAAAISVALEFGVDLNTIKDVLSRFKPLDFRMSHERFADLDIIDDSYNSSPKALIGGLEFISNLEYRGLKIAVLSDMLELGEFSDQKHLELGVSAADLDLDYYLCYGHYIKYFIEGLIKAGFPRDKVIFSDKELLADEITAVLAQSKEPKMLFFKASHAMHIDDIIKRVKEQAA